MCGGGGVIHTETLPFIVLLRTPLMITGLNLFYGEGSVTDTLCWERSVRAGGTAVIYAEMIASGCTLY